MHCSTVAVQSVSRARGVFVYYMYMYIRAEVYYTCELTRCKSTVGSLLCLPKPKMSQKYILPVLRGSIAASVQLKERVRPSAPLLAGYAPYVTLHNTSSYTVLLHIAVLDELTVCFCPQDGWTALHWAAKEGKVDVVRLLTDAMAHVNMRTEVHRLCNV